MAELSRRESDLRALRALRSELQTVEKLERQLSVLSKEVKEVNEKYVNSAMQHKHDVANAERLKWKYEIEHDKKINKYQKTVFVVTLILLSIALAISSVFFYLKLEQMKTTVYELTGIGNVSSFPILFMIAHVTVVGFLGWLFIRFYRRKDD